MGESMPRIILVTDPMNLTRSYDLDHNDSEGYTAVIVEKLVEALSEISPEVVHCDDLSRFASTAERMRDAVVVPAYFGPASPNSKAIVPSVCEALGVKYVGADAYTQALCNDKYLSKLYARDLGLGSGDAVVVRGESDLWDIGRLRCPLIVKPNFGGGSNGISQQSVFHDADDAKAHARRMLLTQKVPILVEEYVVGYEVQVIFAQLADDSLLRGQFGMRMDGNDYFTDDVFGLETKKIRQRIISFEKVALIPDEYVHVMERIFQSFSRAGMMRIDCRVAKDGTPSLIELSPDCSISFRSGMKRMFESNGYDYPGMLRELICFSLGSDS